MHISKNAYGAGVVEGMRMGRYFGIIETGREVVWGALNPDTPIF
jgi:hypothetical protein